MQRSYLFWHVVWCVMRKSVSDLPRSISLATFLVVLYAMLKGEGLTTVSVSDGCAVVGLIFLVFGLFRLVKRLGFFDSTEYGWKKLIEIIRHKQYSKEGSEVGSFLDYLSRPRTEKPIVVPILVALSCLLVSIVTAWI